MQKGDKRHSMKVVVRRTGLSPHVIRVWERRYGAVDPARTSTNRRLYSDADIERLQWLHRATRQGHSIGQIARLPADELADLVNAEPAAVSLPTIPSPPSSAAGETVDSGAILDRCIAAVRELDAPALEDELARAAVGMSRKKLLEELVHPLMQRTGDMWADGSLRVAHEHLASSAVRSLLGSMQAADQAPDSAPSLVVTTPAGQLHEIGSLLVATLASTEGWRVTYLGPNLPAEEIAGAVLQNRARAVALSIIYPGDDPRLAPELVKLRRATGAETAILVGGRAAPSYRDTLDRIGAVYIEELSSLPGELEIIRSASRT